MGKMKWMTAVVWLAVLAGVVAQAAAGEVPPDSVGADTVFVVYADAKHLTPDLLRTAAFAALGENVELVNEFIANFKDRYEKAAHAGVESITVVGTSSQRIADAGDDLAADPKARRSMNPPVVYFHMNANGNLKALEKLMTQDMAEKQQQDVVFERDGNWVVMHRKNQNAPEKVDAERTRAFNEALAAIREAAIGVVIVPDARMKTEMDKMAQREGSSKLAKDALPALSTSQWITLALALGNDPGVKLTANAADTRSAGQLRDAVDTALDDVKHPGENAGPMVLIGPLLAPAIDGIKPIVNGNKVTSSLSGDGLKTVANMIVQLRALTAQAKDKGNAKPQ